MTMINSSPNWSSRSGRSPSIRLVTGYSGQLMIGLTSSAIVTSTARRRLPSSSTSHEERTLQTRAEVHAQLRERVAQRARRVEAEYDVSSTVDGGGAGSGCRATPLAAKSARRATHPMTSSRKRLKLSSSTTVAKAQPQQAVRHQQRLRQSTCSVR